MLRRCAGGDSPALVEKCFHEHPCVRSERDSDADSAKASPPLALARVFQGFDRARLQRTERYFEASAREFVARSLASCVILTTPCVATQSPEQVRLVVLPQNRRHTAVAVFDG